MGSRSAEPDFRTVTPFSPLLTKALKRGFQGFFLSLLRMAAKLHQDWRYDAKLILSAWKKGKESPREACCRAAASWISALWRRICWALILSALPD